MLHFGLFLASMGTDVAKNVLVSFILIMPKMMVAASRLGRPLLDLFSSLCNASEGNVIVVT